MSLPTLLHAVPRRRSLDDLLHEARASFVRLTPRQAWRAQAAGALVVDLRSAAERAATGGLPGALVLERTDLERHFAGDDSGRDIVLVCRDGVASSLGAASLQALGLHRVTDVEGGFASWVADGLPTVTGRTEVGERSPDRAALEIDEDRWEARVDGRAVYLTAQEFRILSFLHSANGRVVTRGSLGAALNLYPADGRALDVHICRLRTKLGSQRTFLRTVRGVGWRLLREDL